MATSREHWVVEVDTPKQIHDLIENSFTHNFKWVGRKELYEVVTVEGHSIRATEDQLFFTDIFSEPKPLRDLQEGWRLKLWKHENMEWDGEGTWEEGCIKGWIYGDGTINKKGLNKYGVLIFCKPDFCMINFFVNLLNNKIEPYPHQGNFELRSKEITDLIRRFDVEGEKEIHSGIEGASSTYLKGFLSTFFDADGHACKDRSQIHLSQSDKPRLEAIQRILLRFGINSTIHEKKQIKRQIVCGDMCNVKTKYRLYFGRSNVTTFLDRISFNHPDKRKMSEIMHVSRKWSLQEDFTCCVKTIISVGIQDVYDTRIGQYDCNGFVLQGGL